MTSSIRTTLGVMLVATCIAGFANGQTQEFVVALSGEKRLDTYSIDDQGAMSVQSQTATEHSPGTLRFDETGRNLYVGMTNPSQIAVFRAGPDGLAKLQSVDAPDKPSFLTISPNGQFLLAAYYATGQVTVHRILGEGRLSNEPIQTIATDSHAHSVAIDRTGKFVFVSHTRPNRISQFRMDPITGRLSANDPALLQREAMTGPRHFSFHPSKEFAYGSNEQGVSVSQYSLNSKTGLLGHLQTIRSIPADYLGKASTSEVLVHPSGRFVYVSNRRHGTIAVFTVNARTGNLKLLQTAPSSEMVRSFGLSADGRFLVAACQGTGLLIGYTIAKDGKLQQIASHNAGKRPWWVAFPPETNQSSANQAATSGTIQSEHATVTSQQQDRSLSLGQGTMSGEVTSSSVFLQTRLTKGTALDSTGDLPGSKGVVSFQWSTQDGFGESQQSQFRDAVSQNDFIVREELTELDPDTKYFYRVIYGSSEAKTQDGPTCSFRTMPGDDISRDVNFIVASCMNYIKFMHGRKGNARGPLTATAEDKRLGFPAFEVMRKQQPEFFIGTGDIVYYDNPYRVAKTTEELRKCWHEQFRFPRMIEFFQDVPAYWSKDDHDFRYNDSDNESERLPLPDTGIDIFHEQLPLAATDAKDRKCYRTIRVSRDVQIWLTEGRDYRSANDSPDGSKKSMWGKTQRDWIKASLAASDAKWKLLINPTPMVGPDDGYKKDNHANLAGFRYEADEFFDWVKTQGIENLFLVCGDRHWQYHSIHPSGIHEFACGALNDENSRMGVPPGAEFGSDPEANVIQPYTSPERSGGFVHVKAGKTLEVVFFNDEGRSLYQFQSPESTERRQ